MAECEEPRCTSIAVKDWKGRKVCQDHYDQYKEKHEQDLMDMNEY